MKALRATLAALLMMAMLAFPAFAQDGKAGAGDDQQVPDNQQSGGGKEMVTKTFELTVTGDVPEGTAFFAAFVDASADGTEGSILVFCGDPGLQTGGAEPQAACEAGVFTRTVEIAAGTTIEFAFVRTSPGDEEGETFHAGRETLNADMTNTAFYTFGKGTGAGEVPDNQQEGEKPDTGAGDKQETPDNQQEGEKPDTGAGEVPDSQQEGENPDTGAGKMPDNQQEGEKPDTGAGETPDNQQDDVQDDQQGEMPKELPDTGAGGLAPVGLPIGGVLAALAAVICLGLRLVRH